MTDNVNQAKGDKSPDEWKPPLLSFYCTYASSWIQVKSYWQLSITSSEKAALQTMLGYCEGDSGSSGNATAGNGTVSGIPNVAPSGRRLRGVRYVATVALAVVGLGIWL